MEDKKVAIAHEETRLLKAACPGGKQLHTQAQEEGGAQNSAAQKPGFFPFSSPLFFASAFLHLHVQHKRPGCIYSWTSDRLISKCGWESFTGIDQEECNYLNYNSSASK